MKQQGGTVPMQINLLQVFSAFFLSASEVIRLTLPYLSEMAGKEGTENASLLLAFLEFWDLYTEVRFRLTLRCIFKSSGLNCLL